MLMMRASAAISSADCLTMIGDRDPDWIASPLCWLKLSSHLSWDTNLYQRTKIYLVCWIFVWRLGISSEKL